MLVQTLAFEEIDVNFLIVGHTHSSIDQYFSVLSKAIHKAQFIGSPLALERLLKSAHNIKKYGKRPYLVRPIRVYYDIKSAFKPYINNKVMVIFVLLYIFTLFNVLLFA